jgi:hypothetical protein
VADTHAEPVAMHLYYFNHFISTILFQPFYFNHIEWQGIMKQLAA